MFDMKDGHCHVAAYLEDFENISQRRQKVDLNDFCTTFVESMQRSSIQFCLRPILWPLSSKGANADPR